MSTSESLIEQLQALGISPATKKPRMWVPLDDVIAIVREHFNVDKRGISEALSQLLRLKDHKDRCGKTLWYEQEQPKVWGMARAAMQEFMNTAPCDSSNAVGGAADNKGPSVSVSADASDTRKDSASAAPTSSDAPVEHIDEGALADELDAIEAAETEQQAGDMVEQIQRRIAEVCDSPNHYIPWSRRMKIARAIASMIKASEMRYNDDDLQAALQPVINNHYETNMSTPEIGRRIIQALRPFLRSPEPVASEAVENPVFKFLLGEGDLEGRWFGDEPPPHSSGRKAPYWWRKHLRAAISALTASTTSTGGNHQKPQEEKP